MRRTNQLLILFILMLLPQIGNSISRTWYQKAHIGGEARHRCTAFSIGNKGYYGGGHVNSGATVTYQDYWEYDPATNSWTQIADYGGGARYHSSAFTIGNAGYVGCGENGSHAYTNDFWKYVPEVNTWFPISNFPGTERRGGTAFTIDGIGYFGTGQSDEGYHTDFYSYNPETDSWTEVAEFTGEPRSAAVGFSYGAKGYLGTGHKVGEALNDFYEFDPISNSWSVKASVGGPIRQDAMAFTIDGKGYIGTGNDNLGNDFKDIWEYDFSTDTWIQIADFGGQKRRYAVTFVIDDIPYLAGGTDGTNFKDFWAYAPSVSLTENQLEQLNISIYPNPSNNKITISTILPNNLSKNVQYSIIDLSGKIIQEQKPIENKITLFKEEIGTGIYFVRFHYNNQILLSKKFVLN